MNKVALKQSVGKKCLLLTFIVLLSQLISENVIAQPSWNKKFVQVLWNVQKDGIAIATPFYHYSFGPKSVHGFLKRCKFEASVNGTEYYKLMDISTERQNKSNMTTMYFKNKLKGAVIIFKKDVILPSSGSKWPENLSSFMEVKVPNIKSETVAAFGLVWFLEDAYKDVRFIRISGTWQVDDLHPEYFIEEVYDLNKLGQSMLKSNTPDVNAKLSKKDVIKVFKESEDIVIKGAGLDSKIKVYTTSGVEIKSIISNNDVVKIKVPAKQIYHVRVGKSGYSVAL